MPEPDLSRPTLTPPPEPPGPAEPDGRPSELGRPPRDWGDRLFQALCLLAGLTVLGLIVALAVMLVWGSWPVLLRAAELELFTTTLWRPDRDPPVFGALVFIYGTLVTSAIAMAVAVPLGVGTAAFLSEIAPAWVRRSGSFLVELLAAIPSVVYGLWGIFFLAPILQDVFDRVGGPNTSGKGLLAAGLILAIMVLPYITAISFDVMRAVPRSQREGSLALGATRWQMIRTTVLPYARPGIIAACFLALGRALGETMAVTMLIGNRSQQIDLSVFGMGDSMASVIANQLNEAINDLHRAALVTIGLLLFGVTTVTNALARLLIARMARARAPRRARPAGPPEPAAAPAEAGEHRRAADLPEPPPGPVRESEAHRRRVILADRVMTAVLGLCQVATVVPLFLILGYIAYRGAGALDWAFFTELPKYPGAPQRGLAHALLGSVYMVSLATFFAVPLSILAAVFLAEFPRHRLAQPVRFVAELLGGVPSIVIGVFAYAVVVVPLGSFSAWAGIFALGVMMIPVVVRSSEEAMKLVPGGLREASYALGASQWQTVLNVILPAAMPAIITGVFLAVGRIAGETAPLLLTAYGSNYWMTSPGDQAPFLPKYIYEYSLSPYPDEQNQAWAAALVLVTFVMLVNVGIRLTAGRGAIVASRAG